MFTWQTQDTPSLLIDDTEEIFTFPRQDSPFLDSTTDLIVWSDDFWNDSESPDAANHHDFADHALLSAAQEVALAQQMQAAFMALQHTLVASPAHLERLVIHVTDEHWQNDREFPADDAVRCDHIVTHHDQWQVMQYLAANDPTLQDAADRQHLTLTQALQCFPLTRDLLLSVAEASVQQDAGNAPAQYPLARQLAVLYRLRNEFISRNIRLVYFIARRHLDKGMELEDMVQEGILGLFRATLKFDANAGTRFSTYAYWWIRQAIRQAITRQRSLIRFPNNVNLQLNRVHSFRQRYLLQFGHWPNKHDIQHSTGLSASAVKDLLTLSNRCISADSPLRDETHMTLLDNLSEDDTLPPPEQQLERDDLHRRIERYLSLLPPREATVLKLKYGIGEEKAYTLHEIAPVIGVSGERVRQLEKLALSKLRQQLAEEKDF